MDKKIENVIRNQFSGEFHTDNLYRMLYATDASVYRKLPLAVAFPKNEADIQLLVRIAGEHGFGLIPRTAGTSLAGQCVGEGIVVDVSRHFNKIIELNVEQRTVKVQPGVIRDELNQYLFEHQLFFGPNTSTSNRCMIGGMVGNNSCGTTSIRYGVTRDKVLQMRTVLSDGSIIDFKPLSSAEIDKKINSDSLESNIYNKLYKTLSNKDIQLEIKLHFPDPEIHRRNTGYAVDALLEFEDFGGTQKDLNLCRLLTGSEGTLAFTTEITLQLDPLPPAYSSMVVTHYNKLQDCLEDVAPLMRHGLYLCEMMDKVILDCTKNNRLYEKNREFVQGDPAALLMLELRDDSQAGLESQEKALLETISDTGKSYAHVILKGEESAKAISLRKAGLGLLGNMKGDSKAVACIEDTAVTLDRLADFIADFTGIMKQFSQEAVYYAHAGAGELHLRPILNLKRSEDVALFRKITEEVALLTKKYRGSFSGEHGDGRVRGEFIPFMIGDKNFQLLREIKSVFDPKNIFNPGKLIDPLPMDEDLRYNTDREEPLVETLMDFSDTEGYLRAAEQCNGSGDCRKTHEMPGGMCPSYHATLDEKDTTRARANTLREILTSAGNNNGFKREELKEVMELCISCKACASECPSNVDMATLKAEFLYQYQEANGYSLRNRLFAHAASLNKKGARFPGLVNALHRGKLTSGLFKKVYGISGKRSLPKVSSVDFNKYIQLINNELVDNKLNVLLFIDEFTQNLDVEVGKDAIEFLIKTGYNVELFMGDSTRALISKGFLKSAKRIAAKNVKELSEKIDSFDWIVGLEPSAILTFRDEFKRFGLDSNTVNKIASKSLLFDEFVAREAANGNIGPELFTAEQRDIFIHCHCHQKALASQKDSFDALNIPENYNVRLINSGCCGMAGSFGYEAEHYEISMRMGELRLFPAIRKKDPNAIIVANGTSCRHQIWDGTQREALHPATVLNKALKD